MKTDKKSLRDFATSSDRRIFLSQQLKVTLAHIAKTTIEDSMVVGQNIENFIGATQIPLGVAGPIRIKSQGSKVKDYYIPCATTEGALVASISRGCKAVTLSGGVYTVTEDVGMSRGPVFKVSNLEHGMQVQDWLKQNNPLLAEATEQTSSHLKLTGLKIALVGRSLFVRFNYHTDDAMGMNMVTIATAKAVKLIEEQTQAKCISLAGNFDIDKKPAWLNFIEGRGKKCWADAIIPKIVVKEILKTTPEKIVEVVKQKAHLGSIMSGSLGFNSHFANVISAIFIATGQDPAHVVEGSLGVTDALVEKNGDLYFSIYLPALALGTVGGGTSLPTQQEAFDLIGLNNRTDVIEFARVVTSAVLAGELSLVASLAENSLVRAHQSLGRRKR